VAVDLLTLGGTRAVEGVKNRDAETPRMDSGERKTLLDELKLTDFFSNETKAILEL